MQRHGTSTNTKIIFIYTSATPPQFQKQTEHLETFD